MEFKKIMGKAVLLCAVAFAAACSQDEFDETLRADSGTATLRLSAVGFTGETRLTRAELKTGEDVIKNVWVAQFDGSDASKIIKGPTYYSSITGNTVAADLETTNGSKVYVVANVPADLFSSFDKTNGTEAAFKGTAIKYTSEITCDGTSNVLPMVGVKEVTSSDSSVEVPMTRAVARIDFTLKHDATSPTDLTLTDCWLEYVPNNSSIEDKTPTTTRVYPTKADDDQFLGYDVADAKFVYGKQASFSLSKGGTKTITWYVPENLAGQNSTIGAAKDKGAKTAPDNAMRIVVKGTCTYKGAANTEVSFTIYPGANATTDFNVQRNHVYTVSSTIKGLNINDKRVTVQDYFDLSADGTANCYMIHKNNKYKFNCKVAGNGKIYRTDVLSGGTLIASDFSSATLATGTTAEILWQGSGNSYGTSETVIKNAQLEGDYITFETAGTTSFVEGNALIALKNGTATVWSWHIWATNYTPKDDNSNVDDYTLNTTYAEQAKEYVMRCNLGATGQGSDGNGAETTAPQCYGLKYQWGRKDPFWHKDTNSTWANGASGNSSAKGTSNMVKTSIENPTTFYINYDTSNYDWIGNGSQKNDYLWGNGERQDVTYSGSYKVNKKRGFKSAFDPCPVGWRVPPQGLWTNASTKYMSKSGNVPAYLNLTSNVERSSVKYPAAGCLNDSSGAVTAVGEIGYYWSSSPYSSEVYAGSLHFHSGGVYPVGSNYRAYGFSVRCVRE